MQAALRTLYESYRLREPMIAKVLRDRSVLPALDALLQQTVDAHLAQLAGALDARFGARGAKGRRLRAAVALALDFSTWQRLDREGLDDATAADLMADLVVAAAGP